MHAYEIPVKIVSAILKTKLAEQSIKVTFLGYLIVQINQMSSYFDMTDRQAIVRYSFNCGPAS